MFWQDDNQPGHNDENAVADLSFALKGKQIPVDHAFALRQALVEQLPWLTQEPLAAIHSIHVASSQHGWERPDHSPGHLIHLSRRTRMTLRLPRERLEDARQLCGRCLRIGDQTLEIGETKEKPLSRHSTLFTRYLVSTDKEEEGAFLQRTADTLDQMGIHIRKALCGKSLPLHTPEGIVTTRSLMLAELSQEESLRLQQQGVGDHKLLGCGIFIPHKGIAPVNASTDDEGN